MSGARALAGRVTRVLLAPLGRVPAPRGPGGTPAYGGQWLCGGTGQGAAYGDPEAVFETTDGVSIPVYRGYRYATKPGWRAFPMLSALAQLVERGRVDAEAASFLERARGHRTLTVALEEVEARVRPLVASNADIFFPGAEAPGARPLPRTQQQTLARRVAQLAALRRAELATLRDLGVTVAPGARVLDVGCGAGTGTVALATLGLQAVGVDSSYSGSEWSSTWQQDEVRELFPGARFVDADIQAGLDEAEGAFDLVCSTSVLEHIPDIDAAVANMYKLTRPGGVMIHAVNQFGSLNGGHALCTLDSPWGHARMSVADLERYLRTFRAYEADTAIAWLRNALNPSCTQRELLRSMVDAGFDILFWEKRSLRHGVAQRQITRQVIAEYLAAHPSGTLDDLMTGDLLVIAQRPAHAA